MSEHRLTPLHDIIEALVNARKSFVSYRLPGQETPTTIIGNCQHFSSSEAIPYDVTGFIMVPFSPDCEEKLVFSQPEWKLNGWNCAFKPSAVIEKSVTIHSDRALPIIADEKTYKHQAARMIAEMQQHTLRKVVLSRIIAQTLPVGFTAGNFFASLCACYPQAFTYVMADGEQLWVGASPETLLEVNNGRGRTMAVAGTRKISSGNHSPLAWRDKEVTEQAYVCEMIRDVLNEEGITQFSEGPARAFQAGPVEHLRTVFDFEIPVSKHSLSLASALHPTPAVCGLPTTTASKLIAETETHNRSYYAGYLGPVDKHNVRLFVNLRCMQIIGKKAYLYVGGGLTADSEINDEWQETRDKAATLLQLLLNNSSQQA
ncbi:MAG: chorismate-binding protein [Bacteroidales bacterium]|nr:chorismate-binding protein [Bacteroidales bacterium]